jgi:hypothetical protein
VELIAGDTAARLDAPEGHLHHVFTAARAVALDDVGQLVLDAPPSQRRHAGPQHLAVQGVGEAHGGAPPAHHHRHEPPGFQLLERGQAVAALEVGETEALADGEQLQHRETRSVHAGEVLVDEFVQRDRGGQVAHEAPGAAFLHEHATLGGTAHQLGEHLEVAAREASQLPQRGRRDRGAEGAVEQVAELVGCERLDVQPHEVAVAMQAGQPCRGGPPEAVRADRPDEERRARHDERHEHGDRRVVEQVEVVHEQHEPAVARHPAQLGAGAVVQAGALVVAHTEPADEWCRQQMGEGAEWDRLHRLVAHGTGGRPPGTLGVAERFFGQARLADTCRAVQHDAARGAGAVMAVDRAELLGAAGQRPVGERHRSTLAPATRLIPREVMARGAVASTRASART